MVPALAVADALRAEGAEVSFIGGGRAEAQLVPAAGFELHRLTVEGLSRSNPLKALRALALAAAALRRARRCSAQLAPDAVMGGGGYVAGPVGLAALTLRVPLVLTEADSHLGLTNRMLARSPEGSAWRSRSPAATARATASPGARSRRRSRTAPAPASTSGFRTG